MAVIKLKTKKDLKTLQKVWTRTELGREGRSIAAMIYMTLTGPDRPPFSMKKPVTKDIGRRARAQWGDEIVEGKLVGYDNWGIASVIRAKRGTLWVRTDQVELF